MIDHLLLHKKVIEIRGDNKNGNLSVKPRQTPEINPNAETLTDLIERESENIREPVSTCSLSKKEIKGFLRKPFKSPMFSSHTQSTERAVKLVSCLKCLSTMEISLCLRLA